MCAGADMKASTRKRERIPLPSASAREPQKTLNSFVLISMVVPNGYPCFRT